ncbi:hypothetical protein V8C35DRAFT_299854 [Trichoderma chlorosporum]
MDPGFSPSDFITELHQELMLLHQSVATVNENFLTLDTALQNYNQKPADAMRLVRETTTHTLTTVQGIYPLISSMSYKLHQLGA